MAEETMITNGKLNALGMDISISDIIGEKIVDQWLATITEEDMNLILKAIESEVFSHDYKEEKYFIKETKKTDNYGYTKTFETPIWKYATEFLTKKLNEKIVEKVEEIINSEEYQNKANEIAQELVDYATEGYKKDLKDRIKNRLVDNTLEKYPTYGGVDLRNIIREEIYNAANRNY